MNARIKNAAKARRYRASHPHYFALKNRIAAFFMSDKYMRDVLRHRGVVASEQNMEKARREIFERRFRLSAIPNTTVLRKMYFEDGLVQRDIAKKCGVHVSLIQRRMQNVGNYNRRRRRRERLLKTLSIMAAAPAIAEICKKHL